MKNNLPNLGNIMPSIRGLNLWTLAQKFKDYTTQKTSTIQLLQKIDIFSLNDDYKAKLLTLEANEQQAFLKAHGTLKRTTGYMKSHSFVLQFQQVIIEYIMCRVYGAQGVSPVFTTTSVRNTANSLKQLGAVPSTYSYSVIPAMNAPAATTTYGILCGTGTTTPVTADYAMQTLVAHGTSAGQLSYQATAVGSAGVVGANVDTIIARVVVNSSGGAITLKEIGMATTVLDSSVTQCFFLIAHDAVNQTINNGEIAVISYDIRTTV